MIIKIIGNIHTFCLQMQKNSLIDLLNDACNKLNRIGSQEEKVELIRKITSKAIATIDTPVGCTNEIT